MPTCKLTTTFTDVLCEIFAGTNNITNVTFVKSKLSKTHVDDVCLKQIKNHKINKMSESSIVKSQMTDEERLALAEKLDKDLDEFISGLEKKRYTEGWPEDRWEEVGQYYHLFWN